MLAERKRKAEEAQRQFNALLENPLSKPYTLTLKYADPRGEEASASVLCAGAILKLEIPLGKVKAGDAALPQFVELNAELEEQGDGGLAITYEFELKDPTKRRRRPRALAPAAAPQAKPKPRRVVLKPGRSEVIHEGEGTIYAISFR